MTSFDDIDDIVAKIMHHDEFDEFIIDPDANNRYENGNLFLYANDGSEITVPISYLITAIES